MHLHEIGIVKGVKVIIDTAFTPDAINNTLQLYEDHKISIVLDHPDTGTIRDKKQLAEALNNYKNINKVYGCTYNLFKEENQLDSMKEILSNLKSDYIIVSTMQHGVKEAVANITDEKYILVFSVNIQHNGWVVDDIKEYLCSC